MTTALLAMVVGATALVVLAVLLRRPEWGLVALCLTSPFGLVYIGAAQVVTVVALAVIGLMIASRWIDDGRPFPPIALSGAVLFWTITVLLSVIASPYRNDSALFGLWLVVSGLLALAVPGIADRRERLKPVVVSWLVSAIVIVVAGEFIKPPPSSDPAEASAEYGGAVIAGRATSVFGQPNEYGVYCMMLLLVSLAVLIGAKGWMRWLALASAVATATGLVQSYSRGAWIGFVLGLIVLVIIDPRARKPVLATLAVLAVVFLAYASAVPNDPTVTLVAERFDSIMNPGQNPDDARPVIVAEGVRQFGDNPLLGVGPNAYPLEGATDRSLEASVGAVHAHNVVVTVAAEQGLLGIAAMLVLAAVVLVTCVPVLPIALRARFPGLDPPGQDWLSGVLVGCIAALCAIMTSGMVDAPLRNALMRTTLWFTLGMAVACGEILRREVAAWGALRAAAPDAREPAPALPSP